VNNLAELILDRATRRPEARFGVVEAPMRLAEAVGIARHASAAFARIGLSAGKRAALIGETSSSYLLAWMSLQLAGVEVGLINPALPTDLLGTMLSNLRVDGAVWVNRAPDVEIVPDCCHVDVTRLAEGRLVLDGREIEVTGSKGELGGLNRGPTEIAGYMHTSGTTGAPKFCAQTHRYFLHLGRFVADSMAISPADTVFAPLPMFHVNPLGYGVVGGLVGGADVLGTARFSARSFWATVREHRATVAILHAPPVEILKRVTTRRDAAGHQIRCIFYADGEFMERFQVPLGYSCYGSTEAGGVCHFWTWRQGDCCTHPEGMSRYGGIPRHDVEWDLSPDGEILVRGKQDHVLCSGYQTAGGLVPLVGENGWFQTGDAGRRDEYGHLIFVERMAESIRVKGEYVPITYVEGVFAEIEELEEVALWRRASELVDHEVVLYVVARGPLPRGKLAQKAETLPRFMRPAVVVRIPSMPRTSGIGKISRRDLARMKVCDLVEL
jgi:crotonobetaine/carnitine-CoA ligase